MKNKIITIYELIGLIKDGKAPKKIKIDKFIFFYDEEENWYYDERKGSLYGYLYARGNFLNNTVEILPEENDEWEDIEELKLQFGGDCKYRFTSENGTEYEFPQEIADIINQLIKNQKYLKEKLEEK